MCAPCYFIGEVRIAPTALVLRAAHCQVEEAADWREGKCATRSLSPDGRATETWEQGLAASAARNVEPPSHHVHLRQAGPGPQTPTRRTRHPHYAHRRISLDSARKGLRSFASAAVGRRQRPTVRGDRSGGHLKACGHRENKNPHPVNRLTFPSQPALRPLPLARFHPPPSTLVPPCTAGGCGYLEGWAKRRREPSRTCESRPELQFPAGDGASEGGCWRAGCRTPRARW